MYHGIGIDKKMVKSKRIGKQGYKPLTSDPRFKKEQTIYEHNLGVYSFKDQDAKNALDNTIQKMKNVLIKNYRNKLNSGSETEEKSILNESTGFNKASNPREKMNALYNATYLASDRDASENNVPNFRDIVLGMGKQKRSEKQKFVTSLGLNDSIIKDRKLASKWTRKKDSNKIVDKSQSMIEKLIRQYLKKHPTPKREENESIEDYQHRLKKHGLQYTVYMGSVFEKFSMGGVYEETKQELENMLTDEEKQAFHAEIDNLSLLEEETIQQNPKLPRSLRKMEKNNNVRVINGISDTAIRMLTIAKWLGLNTKDLLGFRLDLMGWLLLTDEHSLWEIIIASHKAGVKGNEDMTDMVSLDQTIEPLSDYVLRYKVCRDYEGCPMFPHEIVYWQQRFENQEGQKFVPFGGQSQFIKGKTFAKEGRMFQTEEEPADVNDIIVKYNAALAALERSKNSQQQVNICNGILIDIEDIKTIIEGKIKNPNNPYYEYEFESPYTGKMIEAAKNQLNEFLEEIDGFMNYQGPIEDINTLIDQIIVPMKLFLEALEEYLNCTGMCYFETSKNQEYCDMMKNGVVPRIVGLKNKWAPILNNIINTIKKAPPADPQIYLKEYQRHSRRAQVAPIIVYTSPAYKTINPALEANNSNILFRPFRKKLLNNSYYDFANEKTAKSKQEYDEAKVSYDEAKVRNDAADEIEAAMDELDLSIRKSSYKEAKRNYKKAKKEYGPKQRKEFYNDMLIDANMINASLVSSNNRYAGKVYRGTFDFKQVPRYKDGKTVRFSSFTSTSKNPMIALEFLARTNSNNLKFSKFIKPTLLEIELIGQNGIDTTADKYAKPGNKALFEQFDCTWNGTSCREVICLPNTEIEITEVIDNVNLSAYLNEKHKKIKNFQNPESITGKSMDKIDVKLWNQGPRLGKMLEHKEGESDEMSARIDKINYQFNKYIGAHGFIVGKIVKCKEVKKKD